MEAANITIEELVPSFEQKVVILGHIRPDGDCVGSCMGLYHYLHDNMPELDITVCLQEYDHSFKSVLPGTEVIVPMSEMDMTQVFDLCITCDASGMERLGDAAVLFDNAKDTVCIDHHITNQGFAKINYIRGGLSSTGEALCELFDFTKISEACAACLYLAIAHDTGIFKFQATTCDTMMYAGKLLDKGVNPAEIIDRTYYMCTPAHAKLLGRALSVYETAMNGMFVYTVITQKDIAECDARRPDLDGIIDQLRIIEGVEAAAFIYQLENGHYKVSMRSNRIVDCSIICTELGGGGHVNASGADTELTVDELLGHVMKGVELQLKKHDML